MDRRQALCRGFGLGVAALVATAGCSVSDPRVGPPRGTSPDPSAAGSGTSRPHQPGGSTEPDPTPGFAGAAEAAESERRLAGLAAAALAGGWRKQLGARRTLLAAIRDAHLAHATALRSPEPPARPTDDPADALPPAKAAKTLMAALDRLVAAERAAAARHRAAALHTSGAAALLWASMSLAASSFAVAVESGEEVPVRKPKPARAAPLLSDVESMQVLVRQLHAVNYGYPMAIGQLADGPRRNAAIRQLRSRRVLRDALVATLQSRRAEIPVAEAAYVPTVQPRSHATAARLVQDMETRLAPFVGLWLAAAPNPAERGRAFDTLATTVATARSWGAPLRTWPGWSS